MITLHLAMSEDLLLWGTSEGAVAEQGLLLRSIRDAGVSFMPRARNVRHVTAWLPTQNGRPVPPHHWDGAPPPERMPAELAPWPAAVYVLTVPEAVEVLCLIKGRWRLGPELLVGPDLGYWAEALRFAASLLVRQRYLPDLVMREATARAVWLPVISGKDLERFAGLAQRMPHCARALTYAAAPASPPQVPADSLLRRFLAASLDHLVREGQLDLAGAARERANEGGHESVDDAWLHALRSPEDDLRASFEESVEMLRRLWRWREPLARGEGSPLQLCLRLEAPDTPGEGATWFVRFFLRPRDDPSLLVPASDIWAQARRRGASTPSALDRLGPDAHGYLLVSLWQAAAICPEISASLEEVAPSGYRLDTRQALEFLTEKAGALEEAGYGVLLPAWWTRKGKRLGVRARVKSPRARRTGGLSLDELVDVDWSIVLGDTELSLDEIEALAEMKVPLVRLRGQWVQLDPSEMRAFAAFWRDHRSGLARAREVVRMGVGAGNAPVGLVFGGVEVSGWLGDLLDELEGRASFRELPAPRGLSGILRPYQVRGYSWLAFLRRWGLGACLADDMGLGKTIQALALIQSDWEGGGDNVPPGGQAKRRPVLLICPTSVIDNWRKEAERFTPGLPVMVHHGSHRKKGRALKNAVAGQALVISSYPLLQRDAAHLRSLDWAGIILDEAQNIKNPETKQARAARSIKAGYRIALTGTPVENHVGELWSIMDFLNPGLLGSQAEFKWRYLVPIEAERDEAAAGRLRRVTGPFILRRVKTDKSIISDLPEKQEMKSFCRLTREQASLYAAVLRETEAGLGSAEGIQRKGLIFSLLTKLKQVCNHPAQFLGDNSPIPGRSGKVTRLTEMLEEILQVEERVLVFTQFARMGEILQRYLEETFGREVLFLHGGVPKDCRDRMLERFQGGDGPPVFVLSLKAGGTGLNLTAANHVIHFDRWWNPAVENQATDRAFRIGQRRGVLVHKFICVGTLEERIDEMIENKKEIAETVVGSGETWLTELSDRELRAILALGQEALAEHDDGGQP